MDLHARGKGDPKGISFPVKGDNVIEEVRYESGMTTAPHPVPLPVGRGEGGRRPGEGQYIEGVPETAWTFPIGGYLPAQRWLKDRIGRTLGYDEREEYCRIIWALMETKRIMGEIDSTIELYSGWPLK